MQELHGPHVRSRRQSHIRGVVFGLAQSIPFFAYAAAMYYGGYLVENKNVDYEDVFKYNNNNALIAANNLI